MRCEERSFGTDTNKRQVRKNGDGRTNFKKLWTINSHAARSTDDRFKKYLIILVVELFL